MICIASELCCPVLATECTYVGHSTLHCGNYSSHPAVYSESCRWTRSVAWILCGWLPAESTRSISMCDAEGQITNDSQHAEDAIQQSVQVRSYRVA